MKASEIRTRFLKYYEDLEHKAIPPAPIIPTDDPTTLFTNSGMQQLVPYLKGETHPMGKRLVDSQPCFRAEDIDEIGDNRHTTMFEMLGNWSLGDYFKKDQLTWFWKFLTQELNLNPDNLYVTLFEGDSVVPKDEESFNVWKSLGVAEDHIFFYPANKNWWSRVGEPSNMPEGEIGGPTSEVFFRFDDVDHNSNYGDSCHPNCDCGKYIEIGNSVFMEYVMTKSGLKKLPSHNVDFGGGLERLTTASQNSPDIFLTDVFLPLIKVIEKSSNKKYEGSNKESMRLIADHLRGAVFMGAQGIFPSNKLQGYFMRRLLRRAVVQARKLEADVKQIFENIIPEVISFYFEASLIQEVDQKKIREIIYAELNKFEKVLVKGEHEIARKEVIDEKLAFDLYQSLGFPFEITSELVGIKGIVLDENKFNQMLSEHKDKSRTASAGMFKGGLADKSEEVTKLHTATHLLHKALRMVLGTEVSQQGSNITADRLRFDYNYSQKPTPQQLEEIESIINEKIHEDLPVTKTIEDKNKALQSGAMAFFREKYSDKVSVYTIGKNVNNGWFSKELCGGPHVSSTGVIGGVTIKKEENLGAGKRRIYAVLK